MLKLLNVQDKDILGNSSFTKNAIFYKDLLAFCGAYKIITEHENDLPNFCFDVGKKLCLEGICFLMKMYATEFKFETMKLTLEYLKILYYAMACYADEEGLVDEDAIGMEFHEYRLAGADFCAKRKDELVENENKVKHLENSIKTNSLKVISMKKQAKTCRILACVLLAVSVLMLTLPIIILNYSSHSSSLLVAAAVAIVLGFTATVFLFVRSKLLANRNSDLAYHIQTQKKEFGDKVAALSPEQSKYYRVFCEKNEYVLCFAELISRYTNVLSGEEILARSKSYKLLSYNVPYDIGRLFKTQQGQINQILSDIESVSNAGKKDELSEIYSMISDEDWLFYNAEIRYHFLKKFIDVSEKALDWKLEVNGKKIEPFGIRVKELTHEKIAFGVDGGKKIIMSNLSDFTKTKYFKSLDNLNFAEGFSADTLKKVKANYLAHFYCAEFLESEKTANQESGSHNSVLDEMDETGGLEKIPVLVNLKLKIIESDLELGNSDTKTIKSIADSIFVEEENSGSAGLTLSEEDIDYPKFTAKSTEETDDTITYNVNGRKIVGYKID